MKKRILSFVLSVSLITGLMPYMTSAEEKILAEVRYSTDSGMSWTESGLVDALQSSTADNVHIELLQDITLTKDSLENSPLSIAQKANSKLVIDGKGHTVKRGNGITTGLFNVKSAGSIVTFRNITIDGGAIWQTDDLAVRTNSGIKPGSDAGILYVSGGATVVLGNGTKIQNNDTGENGGGAAIIAGNDSSSGTLVMDNGAEIKNNSAKTGTAVYISNENSFFKMNGGKIYGNTAAAPDGGVIYNSGIFEMYGGKIHNNAGGIVSVHNGSVDIPGRPEITGNAGSSTTDVVYTVTGVTLNMDSLSFTNAGESRQLMASVVPDSAKNKNIKWVSSDKNIATVDTAGNVTAISSGTCTITAITEDNNLMAVCKVTVNIPVAPTVTPSATPTTTPSTEPTATPSVTPATTPSTEPTAIPSVTPAEPTVTPSIEPVTTLPPAPTMTPEELTAISLNSGLTGKQAGNKINITWGMADDADGYDVYVQYCGKEFTSKSLNSVNSGETTTLTVNKINGKAIDKKKNYKAYVVAYKTVNGEKVILGRSIYMHFAGSQSKKYTDVESVNVDNSSYSLKPGMTAQINASVTLNDQDKEELSDNHTKQFRYATDDKTIATVSKSGQITATRAGSCTIYVYAKNGHSSQINIVVE